MKAYQTKTLKSFVFMGTAAKIEAVHHETTVIPLGLEQRERKYSVYRGFGELG